MKKENLFKSCKDQSSLMRKFFDLSSSGEYPRPMLLSLMAQRKKELELGLSTSNELKVVKLTLEPPTKFMNKDGIRVTRDFQMSNRIEMWSDGTATF